MQLHVGLAFANDPCHCTSASLSYISASPVLGLALLSHPSGHECPSYMLKNCLHTLSFLRFLDLVRRSCPKTTRRSANFHSFRLSLVRRLCSETARRPASQRQVSFFRCRPWSALLFKNSPPPRQAFRHSSPLVKHKLVLMVFSSNVLHFPVFFPAAVPSYEPSAVTLCLHGSFLFPLPPFQPPSVFLFKPRTAAPIFIVFC